MSLLRNKIAMAISGSVGAVGIAAVMLSGKSGLEGREHDPYYDIVGVLTVCDGHTGPDIIKGKRYSDAECDALTRTDLLKVQKQVDPMIRVPLTDPQRAAIYSFVYNVGAGAFSKSTLLKRINAGDRQAACQELDRWVYAGGKKWKGLINRRQIEKEVCEWQQQPVTELLKK